MSTPGSFARFVITSVVLFAFVAVGFIAGQRGFSPAVESTAYATPSPLVWESAVAGNQMSMATGRIEEGVEGVFALDHLTGDLFCWVISPRNGTLSRSRSLNVSMFLNVEGDADYVMCTGILNIRGGRTGTSDQLADSVVYVGDGNSGRVAAFTVFYGDSGVRLEHIPDSSNMMTRDPSIVRDQGDSK